MFLDSQFGFVLSSLLVFGWVSQSPIRRAAALGRLRNRFWRTAQMPISCLLVSMT